MLFRDFQNKLKSKLRYFVFPLQHIYYRDICGKMYSLKRHCHLHCGPIYCRFFFHVNLSRDLENNNCFEAETSCVFLGEDPESIDFDPPALEDGSCIDLPVLIMAGNRPQYLFRMLKSLRRVQGLNPDMVTVFIDGFFDEPASVARMFGLRVFEHEGVSKKNSRICQVKLC